MYCPCLVNGLSIKLEANINLLNCPGSLGSFPDPPELPFVPPEVDDVLEKKFDPHRQLFALRQSLETLEVLIHANLKSQEPRRFEKQAFKNSLFKVESTSVDP